MPVYLQGVSCSSVPYVGDADKYISNPTNCHLLQRIYNSGTWEYGTVCIFFILFAENEVECEKFSKFSFMAFPKNVVEYGIVGKFSFIAFPKNVVEYRIVGKFSFIPFLKKRGGIIFSFFRVLPRKGLKDVFLFQMCLMTC